MKNLKGLTIEELQEFFLEIGEKKFRAKQVYEWIYKGALSFDEMTNISKDLRDKLNEKAYISTLDIEVVQQSKTDGTRKYLFNLGDGNAIESVFMKYKYGNSLCVSGQAGCRMGCKFCASTLGGLKRNLEAFEIVDEILAVERETGEKINHIVVMGTGEPLDNYENLSKFIKIINSKEGLNIGMRNITVSTCGLVPMILKFAEDFPQVNLAISLHGPNDDIRGSMMPINNKYSVRELIDACKTYVSKTNRRITFEYTLVADKNDSKENINQLIGLLRGINCHVNLIPLNKVTESGLNSSSRKNAENIARRLEGAGITATVRRELGADIDAACGQLRLNKNKA
ncbi:MAG: 23S rRNA (adenine(2503)-C(2))-methyltransferase RlmN [Anaerovoracaceae bacterium]